MRNKPSGALIVIEGPDGVGKSTISELLSSRLRSGEREVLHLSFPGKEKGTLGDLVYGIHHGASALAVAPTELARQALHVAAHFDSIERQILPALKRGATVVLDRFWWSTVVYGVANGCDPLALMSLVEAERRVWEKHTPTLAVLLRTPKPLRLGESHKGWRELAANYTQLATREQDKYPVLVIDNTRTPEAAIDSIVASLHTSLGRTNAVSEQDRQSSATYTILSKHILPLQPSVVHDTYWRFAAERQRVFFGRLRGDAAPWTTDPILSTYKFTNAYRASDRASQYLIRNVIYREDLPNSPNEIFFRVMIFKLFNKIETWETLQQEIGPIVYEGFKPDRYSAILTRSRSAGNAIYSAAYIMPSGPRAGAFQIKHDYHLALIDRMITEAVPLRLTECRDMQRAFELLKSYPGIGDFLAYQYVIDLNYSTLTDFRESDFVVPGPGALDGIRKCFVDRGGLNEPEVIKFVADRQGREFERLGISFPQLWDRPLQLIDCQNLFCEVDKYSRVKHPEIIGITGRSRIKQRFEARGPLPDPWYPPKWNLNAKIVEWRRSDRLEGFSKS